MISKLTSKKGPIAWQRWIISKKSLTCLKGHRRTYEKRYEDVLKYSDVARTEKLKTLVLEQNDKVIAHFKKMLDVVEDDQVNAYITAQMEDAQGVEKQITEIFSMYCQSIQDNVAQGIQIKRAEDNDGKIEGNLDETAINVRPKVHLKNVHKKAVILESDISLKDFETWRRKISDYLVLTGLNEASK